MASDGGAMTSESPCPVSPVPIELESSSCVAIVCSCCTCSSAVGSGMPAAGGAVGVVTVTVGGVCCSEGGAWSSRYGTVITRSSCGALRWASAISSTSVIALRCPIAAYVSARLRFFC